MVRVIKHAEAHYEVKDVAFGKAYRWRPERIIIECVCGQRPTLTASFTACDGCGTDHAAVFWGELFAGSSDDDEAN